MIGVTVDAAIARQVDQMQFSDMLAGVTQGMLQDGVLTECYVRDGISNRRNILTDSSPGAQV